MAKKPLSKDPTEHATECRCTLCKIWWEERGLPMPTTGEDEPDPELEDAAEDDEDEIDFGLPMRT